MKNDGQVRGLGWILSLCVLVAMAIITACEMRYAYAEELAFLGPWALVMVVVAWAVRISR